MHEIATLAQRRDALDDEELAHLEEQSTLADELAALDGRLPDLRVGRPSRREAALAAAEAASRRPSSPTSRRSPRRGRRAASTPGCSSRYERLRGTVRRRRRRPPQGHALRGLPPRPVDGRGRRGARGRPGAVRRLPAVRAAARRRSELVFFWFVGTAVVTVWFVFRDPSFDYRLLVVGSVLPLVDVLFGGARVLHTLVVQRGAAGRGDAGDRRSRARGGALLLGLPIGTLLAPRVRRCLGRHATCSGGRSAVGASTTPPLPEAARGWWNVPLELVGIGILVWVWRTARLQDRARRAVAWRTGRLFAEAA